MRIQKTTDYLDTSKTSDYPDGGKIQQTIPKQNKKKQRQIRVQDTINKPGFKTTTDDPDEQKKNGQCGYTKKKQLTIRDTKNKNTRS